MQVPPEGTRVEQASKEGWSESWDEYANERTWNILDVVNEVSNETGKTVAQIALNWLLQMPGITAPIIGVRTLKHLEDNLGATGWALTSEHMGRLINVSDRPLYYPHSMIAGFSPPRER
jgi:aryl-alcohol dehydrogenase-like predicted oxidoreductase